MPRPSTDGSGFVADRDAKPYEGMRVDACTRGAQNKIAHAALSLRGGSDALPATLRAGHSEAIHKGLLKAWLAMEIEDFPLWFEWQQGCFELIQKNLMALSEPRPPPAAHTTLCRQHHTRAHARARVAPELTLLPSPSPRHSLALL